MRLINLIFIKLSNINTYLSWKLVISESIVYIIVIVCGCLWCAGCSKYNQEEYIIMEGKCKYGL